MVPREAAEQARADAAFTVEAVDERERVTDHDVAAFVDVVAESVGEHGRWIHYGLTSSDVLDTALALQLRQAGEIVVAGARAYRDALIARALEHRDTLCVGRTHGVHAEPTTFGLRLAGFAFEADRNVERLEQAFAQLAFGKLSGAVGTYASIPPAVEARVMERLGLERRGHRHPGRAARPPRGAARGDRDRRRRPGALRDRDPQPAENRAARGRGAVRRRPEGLLGDAAQAQPDPHRADHRPGPGAARLRASGHTRTSPSGTSATSPTPAPSG